MNILDEEIFNIYSKSPGYREFIHNAVLHIEKYELDADSLVIKFERNPDATVFAEYQLSISGTCPNTKDSYKLVQRVEILEIR